MTHVYAANEPRSRRKFWKLRRRVLRAAKEWMEAYVREEDIPAEVLIRLSTGEQFRVEQVGGTVVTVTAMGRG